MTLVHTRERMLRLAPMVDAVHAAGAAIWIQVGHGGLFAMEAWHEPYRVAAPAARCWRRARRVGG